MNLYLPTVLFQSINFLVLVFILWRLLFRPLRRHMQGRAKRIADGLADVEVGTQEIVAERAKVQAEMERARTRGEDALRAARAQAETERSQLLEEARTAARAERDRLLSTMADEQARLETEFIRSLIPRLQTLLARMLDELADTAHLHQVSCERFAAYLSRLPPAQRAELKEAATGKLELVVAREAIPESLHVATTRFASPTVTRVDPDLLAGAQVIAGEILLDGSVRGQLERAIGDLS